MHWPPLPPLALLAGTIVKVLVYSHDLYCPKFTIEDNQTQIGDLQVKEAQEISGGSKLRDWWFLFIDYILYDIQPDDPKEAAAIRWKAPKFYYNAITRTLYHRSHDRILLRCLSHKEAQEILKEAHVEIGQRWFLTLSLTLSDVMHVRFMVTLLIRHQDIFVLRPLPGHLRCKKWTWLVLSAHLHPKNTGLS